MKEYIDILRSIICMKLISMALSVVPKGEFRKSLAAFIVNHINELK